MVGVIGVVRVIGVVGVIENGRSRSGIGKRMNDEV